MVLHFRVLAIFLLFLTVSDAFVEFSFSSMYNIFDFEGVVEVPIPRCDFGCLIFASIDGKYKDSADGIDPYMKNLLIYDYAKDRNQSIAELALEVKDGTSQKVPLDITPSGNYSILNLNGPEEKGSDVTVWIIERTKAHEYNYEIYDAALMNRAAAVPATIVTVMSAKKFRVIADAGEDNSYTARLVGFENALDNNPDFCNHAYKTPINSKFEGFQFQVNSPIISIAFKEAKRVNLKADFDYVNVLELDKSAFISSPGYNGCAKLGGNQVHVAKDYRYNDNYDMHGEPDGYQMYFEADVDLEEGNEIRMHDMTNDQKYALNGANANFQINIPLTQLVLIDYDNITVPQSFMLRYTSTVVPKEPTLATKTTAKTVPTIPTTSEVAASTSPVSSTTVSPTTSVAGGIEGIALALAVLMMMRLRF